MQLADDAPYNGNTATEIEIETENGPAFFDSAKLALFMDFVLTIDNPTLAYGNNSRSIWVTSADGSKKAVLMGLASESDRVDAIRISTRKGIEVGADFSYNNKKTNELKNELKESEDYIALMKAQPVPPRRELSFHEKKVAQLKALIAIREGKTEFQQTADEIVADTPDAQLATEAVIMALTDSGIDVVEATDEMAMAVLENVEIDSNSANSEEESRKRSELDESANNHEFQIFGGNSGYVGYSMSRRAAEARKEGRYPKTDFKKVYRISQSALDALVKVGVIDNTEWHHTSMYGNRTTFYGWNEPWYGDAYAENKKEIDRLTKEQPLNDDAIQAIFYNAKAKDAYENAQRVAKAETEIRKAFWDFDSANQLANLPEEYTASNGVVIVTNGNIIPGYWDGFYKESKAWKNWHRKATDELIDILKEKNKSNPTYEQWRAANQDLISEIYAKHNATPIEFLRTPQGTVYGWTDGKRIYLTREGMNSETPVHEYTHLWARAMMQNNAQGWQSIKDLLQGTPIWNEVMNDANYANIRNNEDAIASEVIARLSGKNGAQKLQEMAGRLISEGNPQAQTLLGRIRQALQDFWHWVGVNLFDIQEFESIEQITDRVLWDMVQGTELGVLEGGSMEFMGSRVEKRRAEIAEHFNGQQLSGNSLSIVNAFAYGSKNEVIEVNGKRIVLKQGNENKAGVSHSLMRHYGTSTGNYSADELLLIPQVIEQGERKQEGAKISYKLDIDGVKYTITTETNNRGVEVFTNFYTNRNDNARSSNTQLSAQADSITASADEVTNNSSNTQEDGELLRPGDEITMNNVATNLYIESGIYIKKLNKLPHLFNTHDGKLNDAQVTIENAKKRIEILDEYKAMIVEDMMPNATNPAQEYLQKQVDRINETIDFLNEVIANPEETSHNPKRFTNRFLFRPEEDAVSTADTFTTAAEAIAQQLGVEIEIDESMPAKGSYNPRTGRIRINPSRHATAEDVQRSVLHETIGHGGIQAVAGKRFGQVCQQVHDMMPNEPQSLLCQKHQ